MKKLKKIILKLMFSNYERGIINSALNVYHDRLFNTKSEATFEDADYAMILSVFFDYDRFKDEEPFPLRDFDINYRVENEYKRYNNQIIDRDKIIKDINQQLLWTERDWQ